MAKSERWWRCVATVYGADEDGNEMSHVIVLDSDEKVLLVKIIDDSNKKLHSCLLEIGMAIFNRAECRCIILPEDPKLTKARLGKSKMEPVDNSNEVEISVIQNVAVDLRILAVNAGLIDKFDYSSTFQLKPKGFKLISGTVVLYKSTYSPKYLPMHAGAQLELDSKYVRVNYNPNNWCFELVGNDTAVTNVFFLLSVCQ